MTKFIFSGINAKTFKIKLLKNGVDPIEMLSSYDILTDAKVNLLSDLKAYTLEKGDKVELIRIANNDVEHEVIIP